MVDHLVHTASVWPHAELIDLSEAATWASAGNVRICMSGRSAPVYGSRRTNQLWRQAGYWSWRAHSAIQSSSVMVRPDERIAASS